MQLPLTQLPAHLTQGLRPLYVLHGDEPLLAQEASYLAASARMLSFSINCMEGYRYWFFVQYQAALPVTSAACQLAVASSKSCTERPLPRLRSFSYSDAAISSARIGNTESSVSLKPWLA